MTDLQSGLIDGMFQAIPVAPTVIEAGQVKAPAVTGSTRNDAPPELPTTAEAGFPGTDSVGRFGISARAGTPPRIVKRLREEIREAIGSPAVADRLREPGADPVETLRTDHPAFVAGEVARWEQVAERIGLKFD